MTKPVRLSPGLRRIAPDLLVGGSPPRLLRLSATGLDALDALLGGQPHPRAGALAARLLAAGVLQPDPEPGAIDDLTVVIPAHGEAANVRRVLDSLPAGLAVIVVDDASPWPLAAALPGHHVIRHERQAGPGAARNTGAAACRTSLIAFIDADVAVSPGCLPRLTGHFRDPQVVAVAPRITSGSGTGWVGVLEAQLCALDLGGQPATVRPGSRVSYLPATALVVRREAFDATAGFDECLLVGEDVDLVWRLAARGRVHYDPSAQVEHAPRTSLTAALRRRADYGASAGPLDRRHPGEVRHLAISPTTALPWLAALVHPLAGVAAAGVSIVVSPRRFPGLPAREARRLMAASQWQQSLGIGRYAVRPGWPLTIAALVTSRRARRLAPAVALAYLAAAAPRLARGPARDLARRLPMMLLDDLAYSTGVWRSAIRHRAPRVLLPAITATARERD